MSNTPLPPAPAHRDTAVQLRYLALRLMDAADLYDEGKGAEGEQTALDTAERVRELVRPQQAS